MYTGVNIFGEYNYDDLPTILVKDVSQSSLYETLQQFAAQSTAALNDAIGALLSGVSADVGAEFGADVGGEMQKISELVGPEATRVGEAWSTQFPISAFADRVMYTQSYLDEANLQTLNAHALNVVVKDVFTNHREMWKALLKKTNYSFNDSRWPGRKTGTLTIRRLANADGQAGYVFVNGNKVLLSTLNMYLTSGAGAVTAANFIAIFDSLAAVGNADSVVVIVGPTTGRAVSALAGFIPIVNPQVSDPSAARAIVQSSKAIGVINGCEVQVWPAFPEGYLFGYDRSKPKPLRKRVHHLPQYQGLRTYTPDDRVHIPENPLVNKFWQNIYGYGVDNRLNGVVMQITTNGAYTDPTL
jgi:hypothetical protein